MEKPLQVNFPTPEFEIKIVLPIALHGSAGWRPGRIRLRPRRGRVARESQNTHPEILLNTQQCLHLFSPFRMALLAVRTRGPACGAAYLISTKVPNIG